MLLLYNSFLFLLAERNYDTYKRELKVIVVIAEKYYYILRGVTISLIFTDYKLLTIFLTSTKYLDIFYRFYKRLSALNIKIKYIKGARNTAANGLLRTIFSSNYKSS